MTDTAVAHQALRLHAADGFELHAALRGDAGSARGGVVIAAAMGVEQRYYADFAQWLARQGWLVLTFDYRGIGASRPARWHASLAGLDADVRTWAERDAAAALAALVARVGPARPVHWIGHSLGGQIVGLVPGHERLERIVTVGCGSGYWRDNVPRLRWSVWLLWFVVMPLALALAGYFPGRRLRKVGDLPRGVALQWRRWCLHPEYLMGEDAGAWRSAYARVRAPILALSFTDDEFLSARNIEALHALFAGAPRHMHRVAPRDIGSARIGHFGFFRRRFEAALWPEVSAWLAA